MTGPSYPLTPSPGSNALGQSFEAGVSPIGTIPEFNVWDTIASQYANSPILTGLIQSWNAAIDPTALLDQFYDHIWNPQTADNYGLEVWARIVGLSGRTIQITGPVFFGFQGNPQAVGFNQAPFYNGAGATTNYIMNDVLFRRVIFAKALANICDGSIQSINQILLTLFFGRGNCWVQDATPVSPTFFGFLGNPQATGFNQSPFYSPSGSNGMTMTYVFTFPLNPIDIGILNSGVLPKPPGVLASVAII